MTAEANGRRSQRPDAAMSTIALTSAVRKLTTVLTEENEYLADNRIRNHGDFTLLKNEALRELLAAQRSGCSEQTLGALHEDLLVIKQLLATNARLLKTQIRALGEVTDIIIGGLRAAESDGTYSRRGALG